MSSKGTEARPEPAQTVPAAEIKLDALDIIITEDPGNTRIVEIYKDEVLNNCERRYFDLLNYYRNGELVEAKITFDHILESLEYLYGDRKVSDTVMLQDFWNEFSDQSAKDSEPDIFGLYNSLYLDEALFSQNGEPNELVIDKTGPQIIKQNDSAYLYVEEKLRSLFPSSAHDLSPEFVRTVYDSYNSYLADRIGIKETYIRSQKYMNFIRNKLKENGLNEIYSYLPAVMTSFYEGSKNGSVWRVENIKEYRSFRNDTGAATALVIKKLKELTSKNNELSVIATILDEGRYGLGKNELLNGKKVFSDDLAGFFAMAVILSNPEDHEMGGVGIDGGEESKYLSSYEDYIKNPSKFASTTASKSSKSGPSKYSGSYIRIMYKVQKGDNLDKIADLFGVSVSDLKKWNPKDTSKKYLYPGMTLYVRGDDFQYYVAKSGDFIGKIASRYGMTEADFKNINDLRSNTIFKGRKYIVRKK